MTIFRFDCPPEDSCHPFEKRSKLSLARVSACVVTMLFLASCSESENSKEKLSCTSSPKLIGVDKSLVARDARQNAIFGVELSRRVRIQAKSAWFGTGAFSGSLGKVGGTEAISLAISVRQLRTLIANQKAIEIALSSGGNGPLPSTSGEVCEMLANSITSLDTGQSDKQFLEHVGEAEAYLKRAYELNGGRNFDADLAAIETMRISQ